MIVPTLPNAILLLLLGGVFIHFVIAGGRTFFFVANGNELAGIIGEVLFYGTGTGVTWWMGIHRPIPPGNQLAAALVLLSSLALYEWARRTIWGRRLGLGWGAHVPETLCDSGPYRYIRHPIYLSYVLAFLAVLIALPHWLTTATFLLNLVVFADCARRDERGIAASPLAADYAGYRQRTGMFLPKFRDSRRI